MIDPEDFRQELELEKLQGRSGPSAVIDVKRRLGDFHRDGRLRKRVFSLSDLGKKRLPLVPVSHPFDEVDLEDLLALLPPRERIYARMKLAGHSNREIAQALGRSVTWVDHIAAKLRPTLARLLNP